jgi:outer membrane protein, heavy metal efflux system
VLRSAILSQFPKINLSVNKAKDTGNVQSRGWAVGVEIPLFDRRQGVIASAKATRQQLFDDYAVRVAEARSMVRQILEDLAVTRAQLTSATESLADLQRLADGYGKAFAGRNADVIAYRDARAALATRRIEQSKLKQDLLELGVGLEIATGRALLSSTITR